jgi:hypothetical protein
MEEQDGETGKPTIISWKSSRQAGCETDYTKIVQQKASPLVIKGLAYHKEKSAFT